MTATDTPSPIITQKIATQLDVKTQQVSAAIFASLHIFLSTVKAQRSLSSLDTEKKQPAGSTICNCAT